MTFPELGRIGKVIEVIVSTLVVIIFAAAIATGQVDVYALAAIPLVIAAILGAEAWRDERDRRWRTLVEIARPLDVEHGMTIVAIRRDRWRLPVGARFEPGLRSTYEPGSYAEVELR